MIVVSGNAVKSPTSTKNGGVLYANFSLAVDIGTKEAPKTCWYSISASGKNAELILNNINPGDKLFITGSPSVDIYLGKDKQVVGVQKIWLEKFEFCAVKPSENNQQVTFTNNSNPNEINPEINKNIITNGDNDF